MGDVDISKQTYPLIKYTRDGKQNWPIGEARLTKNGTGLQCSIHPGHQINGSFFIVLNRDKRHDNAATGTTSTASQKYDLIKYSKRTRKKWPVGEAYYTDNGENILCKIHPSYQLKGTFYFFG